MSKQNQKPDEPKLRPHAYDGITEYDQRLPNWWLYTLYGTIIFSVIYWFFYHQSNASMSDVEKLEVAMMEIQATKLANSIDVSNDDLFYEMAENATFVSSGESIYNQYCMVCHGPNLEGITGLGLNLVDAEWVHGGEPSKIYQTIYDGVLDKGMQAWGPIIGQKSITEVTAFILSKKE